MIATKRKCPICGKEYLAKMDDAWRDFAPHCTVDFSEMVHYVRNARLFNGDEAETFRLSMEEFVAGAGKLLMELSEIDSQEVGQIMTRYGVRL